VENITEAQREASAPDPSMICLGDGRG
jgi:hypothetical protein